MNVRLALGLALALSGLGACAAAGADEPAPSSVEGCARIDSATDRLACYDRFSGRTAPVAKPSNEAPAVAAATPARVPPAASAAASSRSSSSPPSPPSAPSAPSSPPSPPSPQEAFGFHGAEHPVIPTTLKSLTAKVVEIEGDISGHQTLTLDNGQAWRLYGSDELLAKGSPITINRAMLGSFLVKTPSGRTYRAFRLR